MLVVIPVCHKDLDICLKNLEHCLTLDGRCEFKAIVATEQDFNAQPVLDAAAHYFTSIEHFVYDKYGGDPNWPRPQNYAWQSVARWIEARYRSPWFWWEQDAVPLKPHWLHNIAEAHKAGGRTFSGAITQQMGAHYMAGVAVYPWNVSSFMERALLTMAEPWDKMASFKDGILRRTHDITPLIAHVPDRDNVHFEAPEDIGRHIPDTALLFHKCKDGSLLEVLQGKKGDVTGAPSAPSSNVPRGTKYPSFTVQTPWPSGYFTFPTQLGITCYYNCSVCEHKGSKWLFTRRHRHRIQDPFGTISDNASDLCVWKIRPNMTLEPAFLLPQVPARYPNEQWEDPRVIVHEGQTFVSFGTWVHKKPWPGRQSFTKLTPDWRKVEVMWETPYGGNARKAELATAWEKNWVWFPHDEWWHAVYTINPHVVFRVNSEGSAIQTYSNKPLGLVWDYGEPRGGTPPIRISNEEYLCFFHSAMTWQKPKRRYFMGAYTFSAKPPFELLRMTPTPLLVGSEEDYRVLGGPLVIFPNGAIVEESEDLTKTLLVVFGVNDENCGWIRIPWSELEPKLVFAGKKKNLVSRALQALSP